MTMRTPTESAALEAAARSWLGTPFVPNSAVMGSGVCCHRLVAEVLFEAGWLPRFDVPAGAPMHGRAADNSEMERWFDTSPLFTDADPGRLCATDAAGALALLQPGDVVCSRPARLPWHLALALERGRFLHVQYGGSVQIAPNLPPVWAARLARLWRPIPHSP